jgi:hypothetical protein
MAITHPNTIRTALATVIRDAIDADVGAGKLEVYTAARATLLGTLTFSDPCGTITNGVLTFAAITQDTAADATGTAAVFDVKDFSGDVVFSGTITVTGGGGDLTMASLSVTTGEPLQINALTYTASL